MKTAKLYDLASTIRSKNGKVDLVTFDIIFEDVEGYKRVKRYLTREKVKELYNVPDEDIYYFGYLDEGLLIKFTLKRRRPSGSPGDTDILGSQWYGPLLDLEIPLE